MIEIILLYVLPIASLLYIIALIIGLAVMYITMFEIDGIIITSKTDTQVGADSLSYPPKSKNSAPTVSPGDQ